MDKMSKNHLIFLIFYRLIHTAYTVYEFLCDIYFYLTCKVVDYYHELAPQDNQIKYKKLINNITNVPKHLTVLLGPEAASYNDLANLIIWCILARISFISFYDYRGILKKSEEKLKHYVEKKKKKSDNVIWHSNKNSLHKNGYLGRNIHVKILSEEDGKGSVVNLAKILALSEYKNYIDIDFVEKSLRTEFEFPDPDMGLCCGKIFSLYNYPPWQIRITEFFTIKTHYDLKMETFYQLIKKYSKCEQRLGK